MVAQRMTATLIDWVERGRMPDAFTRWGIRRLCRSGLRARDGLLAERRQRHDELARRLENGPIAVETAAANQQHYELPPEFFELCLGPHRKYSACYWPVGVETLAAAEEASLRQVCERAGLADGQDVLELGCGWGSLTLWIAERYPRSRIRAVSNSAPQRHFILAQAAARGLRNVAVQTADMNAFDPGGSFDRIVSIEMLEHVRNHRTLLRRVATWLRPDGALFVHVFAHRTDTYLFESRGPADWLSAHFFTGGIMPSRDLLPSAADHLSLEREWWLDGRHYQRTADAWLANLDRRATEARRILSDAYPPGDVERWLNRWRVFFMACAEMFGLADGAEWGVAHYRFRRG